MFLVDTHLLIWLAEKPELLSTEAAAILSDTRNEICFSTASLWELTIKFALRKPNFNMNPVELRRQLQQAGFNELPIFAEHVLAVARLPAIHKDPFDRLLVAQATVEKMTLLTADDTLAKYPGPIRKV